MTFTSFNGTFPVFFTKNEYVICRPTVNEAALSGEADLSTVSDGAGAVVTVVVDDGGDFTGVVLPGGVPDAVAVFTTDPADTSAAVMV
nr:hypothetical protein [Agreia bicolorata]